jgi:hypothetical protein
LYWLVAVFFVLQVRTHSNVVRGCEGISVCVIATRRIEATDRVLKHGNQMDAEGFW